MTKVSLSSVSSTDENPAASSAFFETDPDVTSIRRFWHLGPFSEDPRGIAVSDGLVYVADGRSPFRDADTGEMNRGGRKVFVFLLDDDASALHRALSVLPVRRRSGGP